MNRSTITRVAAAGAATLTALAVTAGPVAADGAVQQTSGVVWHPQTGMGGQPVDDASAHLTRNRNGVSFRFHADELTPGNAYTLWFVVIDHPEACASSPCTGGDVLLDPEVDGQIFLGAGRVAGDDGTATFAGHVGTGVLEGWNGLRSFDDPWGAEVHLAINDHGPVVPELMPSMIHSYRGGCSDDSPFPGIFPQVALDDGVVGPNTCLLTQVAILQP